MTFITEPSSKENEVIRKRPKLGEIGRKVTRHNLISRRDTLNLVPTKPSLARIESAEKMEEHLFRMYDTNMDGLISMEEFLIFYHICSEGSPEQNLQKARPHSF